MRSHTQNFKNEIGTYGRQINGRIYYYSNYNLTTEGNDLLITEDNIQLITEQFNKSDKTLIDSEHIYSIDIIKNGQLLKSLMKQCNFETDVDLKIGTAITSELGVLVNGSYEYLNYGDYIIYSKEYNADTKTWSYVSYDMMLYSMIKYNGLNVSYPITIRDYINAVAEKMGLNFANKSQEFTNYNQLVLKDLFKGQNVTYRDILDKLSEITAGNLLINDNNELELKYVEELGKNLLNVQKNNEASGIGGLSNITTVENGVLKLNGSLTRNGSNSIIYNYFNIEKSGQYTFSAWINNWTNFENQPLNISLIPKNGSAVINQRITQNFFTTTVQLDSTKEYRISIIVNDYEPHVTFDGSSISIQLEYGDKSTSFQPYTSEKTDEINEEYLKDRNVSFAEKFGPVNKVIISKSNIDLNYVALNNSSISSNGLTQIDIIDNLFTSNGNQQQIAEAILERLSGLYYSLNDFETTGVCYYDFLDLFNVNIENNTYKCLLLNNEIHITTGITENIYTEKIENTQSDIDKYEISTMDNKTVQFRINQQEGKLESKVEKDGVISSINQSSEEVSINANKINLNGAVTANENFKILNDGSMETKNATFKDGKIIISDATGTTEYLLIDKVYDSSIGEYVALIDMRGWDGSENIIEPGRINIVGADSRNYMLIDPNNETVEINADLVVYGDKNRAVKISKDKALLLNAYETATPYFGDIGSNKTDEYGYCKIDIDSMLSKTIEIDTYKIFIQECGEGNLFVEKHDKYFVVKGTPNLEFDWELKAIQKDCKNIRLKEKEIK